MVKRILVCDDDPGLSEIVSSFLGSEGYDVQLSADGRDAIQRIGTFEPDVLITDIQMPGMDGFELLQRCQEMRPDCSVVMMTGYGSVEAAGKAKELGALHYLQKPFPPEDLINILDRLEKGARSSGVMEKRFPSMVGESPAMKEVFSKILQVAGTDLAVLVQGETGTGKELVSTAIHRLSFRNRGPFVTVNCATLEHDLFESELFGHTAGAFTGATRARDGLLSSASGGSIFLDEIGEISRKSQAKLLRAIESGELRRLGETRSRQVDVRVIAATNVPLRAAAAAGDFRSDLFFRLAAFTIQIPALRDRRTDIPLLATALLKRSAKADHRAELGLSSAAIDRLMSYDWPGNVRELDNTVRAAAVACVNAKRDVITADDIALPELSPQGLEANGGAAPMPGASPVVGAPTAERSLQPEIHLPDIREDGSNNYRKLRDALVKDFDERFFTRLLRFTGGNISRAARISGLDRKRLREKLTAVHLNAKDFRER